MPPLIAPSAWRFVLPVGLAGIVLLVFGLEAHNLWLQLPGFLLCGLALFILYFFRNPARPVPDIPHAVFSPVDGTVLEVTREREEHYLKTEAHRVSIFLSLFNVHMNWAPYSGTVRYLQYVPGRFLAAFRSEARVENARNRIGLTTQEGFQIMFQQVAGVIARRLECSLEVGDRVTRGARFGLMRFGSRMDIYLPLDSEIKVRKGDNVRGVSTILAFLPQPQVVETGREALSEEEHAAEGRP